MRGPFGAVGIAVVDTLGETLKDRFRGPEGALGGGVWPREKPLKP